MNNFIVGTVVKNEDGATYEGIVYDRFLELRLQNNTALDIFDMIGPLSTGLLVGSSSEMLLAIQIPVSLQYFSENPPALRLDSWQGRILNPRWQAPKDTYKRSRPELYEKPWILLATSVGQVILNIHEIKLPISVGGYVQWQSNRWDLYAII